MEAKAVEIRSVFDDISHEMSVVLDKLLEYEKFVVSNFFSSGSAHSDIQGFDLAVQILSDLRIIIDDVGEEFDGECIRHYKADPKILNLERSRKIFCQKPKASRTEADSETAVFLFPNS